VYHLLLLRRYLTSKVLPLLAALAVMLCTATVLVVWSIMGGFLTMLLDSGRTLVGDVIIAWPTVGFGYYQQLIDDLEKDPLVDAATPMIETPGMLRLPDGRVELVWIKGVEGKGYDRVTRYAGALWWRSLEKPLPKDLTAADLRVSGSLKFLKTELPDLLRRIEAGIDKFPSGAGGQPSPGVAKLASLKSQFGAALQAARDAISQPQDSPARRTAFLWTLETVERLAADAEDALAVVRAGDASRDPLLFRVSKEGEPLLGDLIHELRERAQQVGAAERILSQIYGDGLLLTKPDPKTHQPVPAMVTGIEVSGFNDRRPEGYYVPAAGISVRGEDGSTTVIDGRMLTKTLTLSVLPMGRKGRAFDTVSRAFPVANEFKTGIYDIDKRTVLVEIGALQKMLKMDEATTLAPAAGSDPYEIQPGPKGESFAASGAVGKSPARVTTILIRGKPGADLARLRDACAAVYQRFSGEHGGDVPEMGSIRISTWEQEQATLIAAVKKEIVMMLMILSIISLTVSFLILAIFWAIVSEKTKDIGILRAIGASRAGVAWIWIGYGLVIGVIGSALGCAAAYSIVWNINPIHDWLGRALGVTVWDPKIYYFTEIPNHVERAKAALVLGAGIGFSVLGALIPAVKASHMDPVRSLRFE
jgi:ABC-type lipoprotein release transport system permease subunit